MALNKITSDAFADGALTANVIANDSIGIEKLKDVNLNIAPEVLTIQVDAPQSGQDVQWIWTWLTSSLPYARSDITNQPQVQVPLYKQGTYVVNNFANEIHDAMTQTHSLYLKWIDGAGTDNNISWAVNAGTFPVTHPNINGGNPTSVQRLNIMVPSTVTPPALVAPTVDYYVENNGNGAYSYVSGPGQTHGAADGDNPNIGPWYRGGTYTINIDATGHPLYLTTDNGSNFSQGTYFGEYTDGVTGSRTDSGTLTITVPADAPDTLYYQCGNHGAMRGVITVKDLAVDVNANGNYVVYFQHTQEGHKTPVEIRPIPSLVNQMCLVYDAVNNQFVPQDLATYVENTPSFKRKIQEVAGTATLVAPDGEAIVAAVNVFYDSSYLPLVGNNAGDLAFATDTNTMYVWTGTNWSSTKPSDLEIQGLIDTSVNNLIDGAPGALDTLNELSSALGDDANFATTVTNSLAGKLSLSGGTMTGNITTGSYGTPSTGTGFRLSGTDLYAQNNATDTARLNVSGDSWFSNSVGFGTQSPTAKVDIANGGLSVSGWSNNNSGLAGGLEIGWDGTKSVIQSYDRVGGGFKTLALTASNIITPQAATNISYAGAVGNGSYKIYSARPTVVADGTGGGTYAPWANMRAFVAGKSGTVRIRAGMYITSGTRYFSFRVVSENTGEIHFDAQDGGGFGAYKYPTSQTGSVHNYVYYEWTVPDLIAGHNYYIQMVPSSSDGTAVYAEAQNCWLGELEVYSQSPGETWGAPIYINQDSGGSGEDVNYDYMSGGKGFYTNQEFRGTEDTFLGWYTFRAYSRFLDVRTNINSNSYMFFMRATGYLYGDGVYNSAMRGGYSYTGNSVINQSNSTPSGSKGFYNFYRDGNGFLCAKLDKVNNGYTEGNIALFFGEFGPANNGIRITHYIQNDSTSNYY